MLKLLGHRGPVRALAFAPDGTRLASVAGREQRVSLWSLPDGKRQLSPGADGSVPTLAFDPANGALVFSSDRHLRRWDLAAGVVEGRWRRAANYCWQIAFAPDGMAAAACFDRYGAADRYRVDLFPVDPSAKKTFLAGDYGFPRAMTFSADGSHLVAGGENRTVRVWRLDDGRKSWSWDCRSAIRALALAPGGAVTAVSVGATLTVYDTATREPLGELNGHGGRYVGALAFGANGTLLSAGGDGTACLWAVSERRERATFDWKVGELTAAAFSPDGALAAVGGTDGLVVWDVE